MPRRNWPVLQSRVAYHDATLRLTRDLVCDPNGVEVEYCRIAARDGVAVLAFTDDGRVVLTRQYRHAVGHDLLELPAGEVDDGESPRRAVIRELREETGYRAASVRKLGVFYPAPSILSYPVHIYHASSVTRGEASQDRHEYIDVRLVAWDRLLRDVQSSRPVDVTLAYAVLLYAHRNGG